MNSVPQLDKLLEKQYRLDYMMTMANIVKSISAI